MISKYAYPEIRRSALFESGRGYYTERYLKKSLQHPSSEELLKAFRAIRRGVRDTVDAIASETFGNDFRGSPLEVVLTAITEQKQVFAGAAHPFYWKPKLRIPDIYENEVNQRIFGAFL